MSSARCQVETLLETMKLRSIDSFGETKCTVMTVSLLVLWPTLVAGHTAAVPPEWVPTPASGVTNAIVRTSPPSPPPPPPPHPTTTTTTTITTTTTTTTATMTDSQGLRPTQSSWLALTRRGPSKRPSLSIPLEYRKKKNVALAVSDANFSKQRWLTIDNSRGKVIAGSSSGGNGSHPSPTDLATDSRSTVVLSGADSGSNAIKVRSRRQCPSCQLPPRSASETERELADAARLESIKRQILIKLGLQGKPNVTAVPSRDFILETLLRAEESFDAGHRASSAVHFESYAEHDTETTTADGIEDDFFGKTSEIIAFAEHGPSLNGQVLVEFSRGQDTEPSLRVKSAVLWVYVQIKGSSRNRRLNNEKKPMLYIFRVLSHKMQNATVLDKNWNELLASQRVTLQHSGWKKINITEGVQKWFSASASGYNGGKLRLLIDCSGCGSWVEPLLFSQPSWPATGSKFNRRRRRYSPRVAKGVTVSKRDQQPHPEGSHHRPFLVIQTDSTVSRRLRRRALECSPTTRACCKQRFFVSFRALGWDDWIIAPSGYYANYCRGDCGGPHRTPDTFLNYHTHVLEEFRRMDSFPDLQPCCAPTKFSSMSLIYFGPDMNIIKRDLPKMVVEECGCP